MCLTARDLADIEDFAELGGYTKELNEEVAGGGVIAALGAARTQDWLDLKGRVLEGDCVCWVVWALMLGKGPAAGVANPRSVANPLSPEEVATLVEEAGLPTPYEAWEMVNAFFNCPDPKEQPEFLYRRGSLFKVSENCLAADPTVAKLVSFIARPVADASESTSFSPSERRNLIGFGFGLDF